MLIAKVILKRLPNASQPFGAYAELRQADHVELLVQGPRDAGGHFLFVERVAADRPSGEDLMGSETLVRPLISIPTDRWQKMSLRIARQRAQPDPHLSGCDYRVKNASVHASPLLGV